MLSGALPKQKKELKKKEYDKAGYRSFLMEKIMEKEVGTTVAITGKDPKERLKELMEYLEKGISSLYESETYREYLDVMAKFHSYSFANSILIRMQKPDATRVAGYHAWKKEFNRQVKKGEKEIKILVPYIRKAYRKKEILNPKTQEPLLDKNGEKLTELEQVELISFQIGNVFDVSQTEGEPLPELGVEELKGSVKDYGIFFQALREISPVPIRFEPMSGRKKGYYHLDEKRIAIKEVSASFRQ